MSLARRIGIRVHLFAGLILLSPTAISAQDPPELPEPPPPPPPPPPNVVFSMPVRNIAEMPIFPTRRPSIALTAPATAVGEEVFLNLDDSSGVTVPPSGVADRAATTRSVRPRIVLRDRSLRLEPKLESGRNK